jgi:hypothetical protein
MLRAALVLLLVVLVMTSYAGAGRVARGRSLSRRALWRLRRAAFAAAVTAFGAMLIGTGLLMDETGTAVIGAGVTLLGASMLWRVRRQWLSVETRSR